MYDVLILSKPELETLLAAVNHRMEDLQAGEDDSNHVAVEALLKLSNRLEITLQEMT